MTRLEEELKDKTPEEQVDFIRDLLYNFSMTCTDSRQALIDWVKGEKLWPLTLN